MTAYENFIAHKGQASTDEGIAPLWMPDALFDFQQYLVEWSLRKGRAAVFATTGMGKSAMQLVWSENVVRKTNRPVLIVAPLAVSSQTIREGAKFGIEVRRAVKGEALTPGVWVTNYERLHHFEASAFAGAACDESSCIKGMDGATRALVTDFLRKMDFRSLWTATPSPNDYVELGTSSEALGYLGHMDMLSRFFKNNRNNSASNPFGRGDTRQVQWRFAGHAEQPFWRWVLLVFRKRGENKVPIRHPTGLMDYIGAREVPTDLLKWRGHEGKQTENKYSQWIWRQYASAFWDDIRGDNVLPYQDCKEPDDERHVHPLQLDVIERAVILWSNEGDTVLTPFLGVGSEAYGAVVNKRRALGVELKPAYYRQAVKNLEAAVNIDRKRQPPPKQRSMFEAMDGEDAP